jgi:nucleoside-diphosphate-sugar epimerase
VKIILAGATGFVGGAVLAGLLKDERVTRVTSITRGAPIVTSKRLVTIVHEGVASFGDSVLERLEDHSACIWAVGGKASARRTGEQLERVNHTFPVKFARSLVARIRAPLTFCHVSAMGAAWSKTPWLRWERPTRLLKGRAEKDLLRLANEPHGFSVLCFRPGGVLPAGSSVLVRRSACGFRHRSGRVRGRACRGSASRCRPKRHRSPPGDTEARARP